MALFNRFCSWLFGQLHYLNEIYSNYRAFYGPFFRRNSMWIKKVGKWVTEKVAEGLLVEGAVEIVKELPEVIEKGKNIILGNDRAEETEQKKSEFKSHLISQSQNIVANNPEVNKLARKLEKFERVGELDNPFNSEAQQSKRQLQSLMQKEMSLIAEKDAGKFGIKYQRPVSSLFDR